MDIATTNLGQSLLLGAALVVCGAVSFPVRLAHRGDLVQRHPAVCAMALSMALLSAHHVPAQDPPLVRWARRGYEALL
jgi:hypothetical protein